MTRDVRPYRWDLLPTVGGRELRLLEALAAQWPVAAAPEPPAESLAPLSAEIGPVRAYDLASLRERLSDPTAFAMRLRRDDGAVGYAVVPGPLGADCASRILRVARPRMNAPRPATRAEQGVCAFAAAALLERYGIEGVYVEAWYEPPATLACALAAGTSGDVGDGRFALGVDVKIDIAGTRGVALVLAAESVAVAAPATRRAVATLLARGGQWLEGARMAVPIVSGLGRVAMRDVLELSRRDVVLLDEAPRPDAGRLAVGRGGFPVTVDGAEVTIAGAYERGTIMDEAVSDDVNVEVACQLGAVHMSARRVLELAPGQVLPMDRPLGGPVELVVGTRVIGTGELVDVDGELGVRVLSLVK